MNSITTAITTSRHGHRWIFDRACNVPTINGTRIRKCVVWWDMVGVGFDYANMGDVRWTPFLLGIYEPYDGNITDHWILSSTEVPRSVWEEKVGATLIPDLNGIESFRYITCDRYMIVGEKTVKYTIVEYSDKYNKDKKAN